MEKDGNHDHHERVCHTAVLAQSRGWKIILYWIRFGTLRVVGKLSEVLPKVISLCIWETSEICWSLPNYLAPLPWPLSNRNWIELVKGQEISEHFFSFPQILQRISWSLPNYLAPSPWPLSNRNWIELVKGRKPQNIFFLQILQKTDFFFANVCPSL